ncbi:hypothetical protein ACP4OV_001666 [Aristida adscensionis]
MPGLSLSSPAPFLASLHLHCSFHATAAAAKAKHRANDRKLYDDEEPLLAPKAAANGVGFNPIPKADEDEDAKFRGCFPCPMVARAAVAGVVWIWDGEAEGESGAAAEIGMGAASGNRSAAGLARPRRWWQWRWQAGAEGESGGAAESGWGPAHATSLPPASRDLVVDQRERADELPDRGGKEEPRGGEWNTGSVRLGKREKWWAPLKSGQLICF